MTAVRQEMPNWLWVSKETGLVLAEGGDTPPCEGCVCLFPDELEEPPTRANIAPDELLSWYAERSLELDATEAAVKAAAASRLERLAGQRASLRRHLERVETLLREEIENRSRRRFVDTPAGRVGFRKGRRKKVLVGEDLAIEWAAEHCPRALRKTIRVLTSELPDDVDVPGVEVREPGDVLYVAAAK